MFGIIFIIGGVCLGGYLSLWGVPFEANLPALRGLTSGEAGFTPEFVALLIALSPLYGIFYCRDC